MSDSKDVLVVPCYNEERRIDAAAFVAFAQSARARLLFVDDGSSDGTHGVLLRIRDTAPDCIDVLALDRNCGKAEAVRQGLRHALTTGANVVGYADADLSTPLEELLYLRDVLDVRPVNVALGSRVARLGARIDRRPVRHYLGRVFATSASLVLAIPVYDTQCGAKWFRSCPALDAALSEPFRSPWAFDVELIGRLLTGTPDVPGLELGTFEEVPLRRWRDVRGTRLRTWGMVRAFSELLLVWRDLRSRRSKVKG